MELLPDSVLDLWWKPNTLHSTPKLVADILECYFLLRTNPSIVKDLNGKPALSGESYPAFNVSRSGELALIGVCSDKPVGVDCESVRTFRELSDVADLSFTSPERAWLVSGDEKSRVSRFFTLWTRKEAVVKAIGLGLAIPLDSFEVLAEDFATSAPTAVPGHGLWWVSSIDAPTGFAAACSSLTPFTTRLRRSWPLNKD